MQPNNKEYVAIGGSKKIAKNNLATKILKDFGVEVADTEPVKAAKPPAIQLPKQQEIPTYDAAYK